MGPARAATARDERAFMSLLSSIGVAVYATDADGRITFFNDAAVALWGRRPELGELWCGSWRLFWPDGRPMPQGECPMAIALRENRPVRGASAMAQRPDGTFVDFEPYPTPIRDASGALVGAVNALVDVTQRRRAEEDLRMTANALNASVEALRASNLVKDEFLGLVSHELRTPITTIYGNAELLRDRMDRYPESQRAQMIEDIAEDANRLQAIVENLLLLSRLQAGARPEIEPQVLTHLVEHEIRSFSRHHPGVAVGLEHRLTQAVILETDRTFFSVLIGNLLENALKYRASDGAAIDVTLEANADEVRVRVLDRGMGLGGLAIEDLVRPFFRPTAQRVASGVGLGLPVCERITASLGGRIWARARSGGGAEFGFALPRSEPTDGN